MSSKSIDKKQSYDYELIAQSFHESGHTLCGLYNFMEVTTVVVMNPRENLDGKTEYICMDPDLLNDIELKNMQLYFELQTHYAGLLAEKIYYKDICGSEKFPMHLKQGSSGDINDASALIKKYKMAEPGRQRALLKNQVQKETTILLEHFWDDIKIIAHLLYKKKKLNFEDLKYLLTRRSANKEFWKEKFKFIKVINQMSLSESDLFSIFRKSRIL